MTLLNDGYTTLKSRRSCCSTQPRSVNVKALRQLTLILPIDYCLRTFNNVVITFTILAGIIAALTFMTYVSYILFNLFLSSYCIGCGLSTSIKDFNNNNNNNKSIRHCLLYIRLLFCGSHKLDKDRHTN